MLKTYFFKKNIRTIVTCFLLSGFVIAWYGFMNQYLCLFYREQSQLFLFDRDYFLQYLRMPGGLTAYFASFLIQFFRFRWIGVLIYLCVFLCLYVVTKAIYKNFSVFNHSFFIAFIPGLLYLPASINMLFDPADELGVILALCGFIALTKLMENKYYYFLIPLSVTVLYILVGGNVIISLSLFMLYSLSRSPLKYALVVMLSLPIPVIVWYFFYFLSFKAACFSLTPFRYPDAVLFNSNTIAWLSVIILPIIGMLLKNIKTGKKWIFMLNSGLAVVLLSLVIKQYNPDLENIVKMGFDAENRRWEEVVETGKKTVVSPLGCFYTNLALLQTGQLAEKMFHYDQIGISGLFIDSKDHFSYYAKSELFYRLGWINPAQHSAYESMSGYSFIKEPNIRNLKRLYDCSAIQQNRSLTTKYGNMLNRSLFYGNYVKRQERNADYPTALVMKNSLIRNMPEVLEIVLEDNSANQAVFEYLMAWYLLERDFEQAKVIFDRYFSSLPYTHIPMHYAEFLLLYKRINNLDDSFYERYPISRELSERFDMMDTLVQSTIDKMIRKTLEDNFKHTYWFYVRFPLVQIKTTPKDEKYIY